MAAAFALCPELETCRRNGEAEQGALHGAAVCAAQFTPSVAIDGNGQLLLEIAASLKLFGGLRNILAQLLSDLHALGLTGFAASAPTATGACLLAFAGQPRHTDNRRDLARMLGDLPVSVMGLDEKTMAMLAAIGVPTLAEVNALPRDGFARRFGPGLLERIDRAFGRSSEAHEFFVLPQRFDVRLELPHITDVADALLFAAKRLFVQLEAFLRARAAAAECIVLRLDHEDFPPTEVSIRLVTAGRSAEHFAALTRERLARLALPAPARAISLEAPVLQPFAMHEASLFPDAAGIPEAWDRLLERLQARLGVEAVRGVAVTSDYRPERAGLEVKITAPAVSARHTDRTRRGHKGVPAAAADSRARRPLWLLRQPRAIVEADGRLLLERNGRLDPRGSLTLLAGPERIESGWWDGEDIARDYFIAQSEDCSLLWIYRRKGPDAAWFLHGIFS